MSIVIPWQGSNLTVPQVNQDGYVTEYRYRDNAGIVAVFVRHSSYVNKKKEKIDRHNVEVTFTQFATSTSEEVVVRSYAVFESKANAPIANVSSAVSSLGLLISNADFQNRMMGWQNQ